MRIYIPGKTFLVGEYAALHGGPAILLTTEPCFSASLAESGLHGIHPESPAGRYWHSQGLPVGIAFKDPLQGLGGLGASGAQFIAAYQLSRHYQALPVSMTQLMETFHAFQTAPASGYDILAQTQSRCVLIEQGQARSFAWPFPDLACILVHSQQKIATHTHVQQLNLHASQIQSLADIAIQAQQAFIDQDAVHFVYLVQAYYAQLLQHELVHPLTIQTMSRFLELPGVLAAKGCGALGADVWALMVRQEAKADLCQYLQQQGHRVLATETELYSISSTIYPSRDREEAEQFYVA